MTHKAKTTVIKQATIDDGIAPVVNWLNGFSGIFTRFCCQGVYKKNEPVNRQEAYVIFYCDDPLDLLKICDHTRYIANIQVEIYEGSLRYRMCFPTKTALDKVVKAIKSKAWSN